MEDLQTRHVGRAGLAVRMSRLGTETAFDVFSRARALELDGHNVIHLELGEPDLDTPDFIKEAAIRALGDGHTHYGPAQGMPELRAAAADYLTSSRGVPFTPDEIIISSGAKPIIFFSILSLVEKGDEVIYPDPGYPIYESVTSFAGGTAVPIALREDNDFRIDVAELREKINDRTKMIILNSPHNPTGSVLRAEDLLGIARQVAGRDIFVLCDEVYCKIIYETCFESLVSIAPELKKNVILLDGFSKTYAMTGWRLGFAAARKDLIAHLTKLTVNSNSCTAPFIQVAGTAALRGPQDSVPQMVTEFRRRRDLVVDGLNALQGVTCRRPHGAFYVFPNIAGTGVDCRTLADRLLYEANVAVLAGTCFGSHGEGYLRLSYANSEANLREALARMSGLLANSAPRAL